MIRLISFASILFFTLLVTPSGLHAQTSCALSVRQPYKSPNSSGVWYVSDDCKKRPVLNPDVYFSHFSTWDDVQTVAASALSQISNHDLGFLPWGTRRTFANGSLLKTVDDPRVFLVISGHKYPIATEVAFRGLGYEFSQVEDVVGDVLSPLTEGETIEGVPSYPANLIFKYDASPSLYVLEKDASTGRFARRHIASFEDVQTAYRTDRLAVLSDDVVIKQSARGSAPQGSNLATIGTVDGVRFSSEVASSAQQPETSNNNTSGSGGGNGTSHTNTGDVCGNFIEEPSEGCDDGPDNGRPGYCDVQCVAFIPLSSPAPSSPTCGNSVREAGETCDDGVSNGNAGFCNSTCSGYIAPAAVCGNGTREEGETCDDGASNGTAGMCNLQCDGTTPVYSPAPTPTTPDTSTPSVDALQGSGVQVSALGENPASGEGVSSLIDNNSQTKWLHQLNTSWVQADLGADTIIASYTLTSANDEAPRDPRNWTLQGSQDGSSWVDLDTRSGVSFSSRFDTQTFTVASPGSYRYYRLEITANAGAPYFTQLAGWQLFTGDAVSTPSNPTAPTTPVCGNGVRESSETCDDGASNGNAGMCNTSCNGTVPSQTTPPPSSGGNTNPSQINISSSNPFNQNSGVGVNLNFVADWTGEHPYIDAFKAARTWIGVPADNSCWDCRSISTDNNGWPINLGGNQATAVIFAGGSEHPIGDYVVLYDGSGSINYSGGGAQIVASTPGRDDVSISNNNDNLLLTITQSSASDPIRNIRFIMPGGICNGDPFQHVPNSSACSGAYTPYENLYSTQIFHGQFLDNLKYFQAIRFMNSMGMNDGITMTTPGDYPSLSNATWQFMPPEIIGRLGNILDADVWVNINHMAEDSLAQSIATRLNSTLDNDRNVYVEYSNELWNTFYIETTRAGFPQHLDISRFSCDNQSDLQAGCAADENPSNPQLCEGHPYPRWIPDCATSVQRHTANRTVRIGEIFDNVFGANRVATTLGAWASNSAWGRDMLAYNSTGIDALAIAPYFGGINENINTSDGWLNQLEQNDLPGSYRETAENRAVANQFGVRLLGYEGGQHALNSNNWQPILEANRSSRMGDLYNQYLTGWRDNGGELMMLYYAHGIPSSFGAWGLLESTFSPHTQPKYQSTIQFIQDNPRWW